MCHSWQAEYSQALSISVLAEDTRVVRRLIVARALFIVALALVGFLMVGTLAKIVQP